MARKTWRDLPSLEHCLGDVGAFLTGFARALATASKARAGDVHIAAYGRVVFNRSGSEVVLDWLAGEGRLQEGAMPVRQTRVPVVYADVAIGELLLSWEDPDGAGDDDFLADCARHLAFMVKRYQVRHWAELRLGRPLLLVGTSEALRGLEVFIEKASHSDLPALLHGEFGTETPYLAAAIHCCGPRRDQPFVQINCAHPQGRPEDWFAQAEGGTLFLSDIDALEPLLQNQLPRHMHSRLGQWLDVSSSAKVRVIASATQDLRRLVDEKVFSRHLLAELDFLSVEVPPLRQRQDDIEPLVVAALEGHGFRPADKLSDEMLELFRAYDWPENAFELDRVVARLAVMTGRDPISAEAIRRHFPAMSPKPAGRRPAPAPVITEVVAPDDEGDDAAGGSMLEHWLRHALNKDLAALANLHPGLRKAIVYLVDHHAEPIRLGTLARQAHVSQSHLSFLFRNGLNTSCRAMLARIRVEKAKELLVDNRHQPITDVALQVGFADLSHFEKCFRREVGQTPRQFRRLAAE